MQSEKDPTRSHGRWISWKTCGIDRWNGESTMSSSYERRNPSCLTDMVELNRTPHIRKEMIYRIKEKKNFKYRVQTCFFGLKHRGTKKNKRRKSIAQGTCLNPNLLSRFLSDVSGSQFSLQHILCAIGNYVSAGVGRNSNQ